MYFIGPFADWVLIGGGSICVYLLCWLVPTSAESLLLSGGLVFQSVLSHPHFSATLHRLYGDPKVRGSYPVAAYVLPFLFLVLTVAAFVFSATVAPALIKLYSLWSPFHFCAQNLGISLIYARRAGRVVSDRERTAVAALLYSSYFYVSSEAEARGGMARFAGINYPLFGLPPWVPSLALCFLIFSGLAFGYLMVRRFREGRGTLPAIFFLPVACQLLWSMLFRHNAIFLGAIPYFHALQYLPIAWYLHVQGSEPAAGGDRWGQTANWVSINLFGGAVLFLLFPFVGASFGYSFVFSHAVTNAIVNLHHFLVDGIIWRLRKPSVRAPLLAEPVACQGAPA